MADRRSLPPYEDDLALLLLRSAERDEPSARAYSEVASALGVSAAVGLGASLPGALASSGLSASGAVRWSSSLFAKGVVVGVSSALLVAGSVGLLRPRLAPSRANAAPIAAALKNAARLTVPVPAPAFSPPLTVPVPALSPSPTVPVPALSPSPTVPVPVPAFSPSPTVPALSRSPARTPKKSSLPEQVLSLDRARVALSSGDAGAALAEISRYRSTWPRGVFVTEASVLEIEALAKRGEIALAGMRAQAFVTLHPDSPQADRLRALIPGASR